MQRWLWFFKLSRLFIVGWLISTWVVYTPTHKHALFLHAFVFVYVDLPVYWLTALWGSHWGNRGKGRLYFLISAPRSMASISPSGCFSAPHFDCVCREHFVVNCKCYRGQVWGEITTRERGRSWGQPALGVPLKLWQLFSGRYDYI